jgi:hypothetical protein
MPLVCHWGHILTFDSAENPHFEKLPEKPKNQSSREIFGTTFDTHADFRPRQ